MASADYIHEIPQSFSGIALEEDSSVFDNADEETSPIQYNDSMSLSSTVPLDIALMAMDTDLVLDSLHRSSKKLRITHGDDLDITYSGSTDSGPGNENPHDDMHTLDSQYSDDDGMQGEIHLLCRATNSLREMLDSKSIHCDFDTESCFSDLDSVVLMEEGHKSSAGDTTATPTTTKLHPVVDELFKMCEDALNAFFQSELLQSKPVQDGIYTIKSRPGHTLKTAFAIYAVVKGVSFLTRIA